MLWSAPRSRSTAFFRMMAARGDFMMVHEPFSYLAEYGHTDIAGKRISAPGDLIRALSSLASRGHVFAKETTGQRYPEVPADQQFLESGAVAVRDLLRGLPANPPDPRRGRLRRSHHLPRRDRPRLLCEHAGIDYRPAALTWQPAGRPEWQLSRRRHADMAASTGFTRTSAKPATGLEQDPVLRSYLCYHLPFYEKLHARRLTA
jgi:hypothetical protein